MVVACVVVRTFLGLELERVRLVPVCLFLGAAPMGWELVAGLLGFAAAFVWALDLVLGGRVCWVIGAAGCPADCAVRGWFAARISSHVVGLVGSHQGASAGMCSWSSVCGQ